MQAWKMDADQRIKELEDKIATLESMIQRAGEAETYQNQLEFLANTALDFLGQTDQSDIYGYIGNKLVELIDDAIVIINSFDEHSMELKVRYFGGGDGIMDRIVAVLGRQPLQQTITLSEDTMQEMFRSANKLYKFEGGLHESSDGNIPKPVARALESLILANETYGITFERGGELYGTATIITKGDSRLENPKVIEGFIFQCSIALYRQHMEAELRNAKKEAEESDKLKSAFLANISHEVRTPMNGIMGLAHLLANPEIGREAQQEYVNLILSSGNVLISLLDDIMDVSRIEANQVVASKEDFPLNELMRELQGFFSTELEMMGKKVLELSCKVALEDNDAVIHTDRVKLRQVLVNLLSNALKFTETGKIEFGYELQQDKSLLFFVTDTGIGISPEKQKRIFERFVQADDSLSRHFGGSGLGLSICKGFVDLLGGKIWVESAPNKGARFYFTIPDVNRSGKTLEEPAEAPSGKGLTASDRNWEDKTILIVEDDHINYQLLEVVLKRTGVNLLHAVTGMDAVRYCREQPRIDLVLMDVQLPEMNGFEAIKLIKESHPSIPIIVQTANSLNEEKTRADEAGCQGFMTKPISLNKFMSEVDKFMQKA
jgi:signal transduction histidine kinase